MALYFQSEYVIPEKIWGNKDIKIAMLEIMRVMSYSSTIAQSIQISYSLTLSTLL